MAAVGVHTAERPGAQVAPGHGDDVRDLRRPRASRRSDGRRGRRGRAGRPAAGAGPSRGARTSPSRLRRVVGTLVATALAVGAVAGVVVGTTRLSAASQASLRAISSPTADVPGGRLVVLGAATSELAPGSGQEVVDVSVRLVGTGADGSQPVVFDPSVLLLRLADGTTVPATRGSVARVPLPVGGAVEGRLGFVTASHVTPPVLLVPDGTGRTTAVQLLVVGAPRPDASAERTAWEPVRG